MGTKAEGTAQKHVLKVRPAIERILPSADFHSTYRDEDGWWRDKTGRNKRAWRYMMQAGLVGWEFSPALTWGEIRDAFLEAGSPSSVDDMKVTKKILGQCKMLANTTKMGSWSWNLPAGPTELLGTCPGSRLAFRAGKPFEPRRKRDPLELSIEPPVLLPIRGMDAEAERRALAKHAVATSRAHTSHDKDTLPPMTNLDAIPRGDLTGLTEEQADSEIFNRFLCNGCYACKGSYGNPSVITVMAWRRKWLFDHALPSGDFARMMVIAIQAAHKKSRGESYSFSGPRASQPERIRRHEAAMSGEGSFSVRHKALPQTPEEKASWNNPRYFRIHDSGDMLNEQYLDAWLDVCRAMPETIFWAPTRVWADKHMAKVLARKKIPRNLALRPSALFFDVPAPEVAGLSAGSASADVSFRRTSTGIAAKALAAKKNAWVCPAYMPTGMGGGALPSRTRKNPPAQRMTELRPGIRTGTGRDLVFYDSEIDSNGDFVIDPHTGKPVVLTAAAKAKLPPGRIAKAQKFQHGGACTLARGAHGEEECRVCWNAADEQIDTSFRRLPVVYAKH